MGTKENFPPPGGGEFVTIEFPSQTAPKRGRESPEKASRPKKQTKISNYWLGNSEPSTSDNLNSNRFKIFNTIEQENEHDKSKEKYPKPPPIFIDGVSNIKPLYELLDKVAKDLYDLKIINSDQVKIQSKTSEAFKTVVKELESKNTQFYTYKPKQERCFKVFLRNIHPSVDLSDLKSELKNLGHEVCNVWNIKHRITKNPLPLFMVELLPNASNKHIYDIQYLMHCKVVFEPPRPKRTIPQCANCQQYGHTKAYCHRVPKCVKCAGNHQSASCPRKTRSNDVKCVLCDGNHPANYKGCGVYQSLRKARFPPSQKPKNTPILQTQTSLKHQETQPTPKLNKNISYADMARQSITDNIQAETSSTDLKNMMEMLQQIMQQVMTLTSLLVNLMPKSAQVAAKP